MESSCKAANVFEIAVVATKKNVFTSSLIDKIVDAGLEGGGKKTVERSCKTTFPKSQVT